jgi:hypothetical protein
MSRGYPTNVIGCSEELGEISSHLDLASGEIDKIQSQLNDARSVVY